MNTLIRKFAHELRNPLTSLYSTIQFIEIQHPEVRSYKFWSCLEDDIEYMNALINNFSDYAKSGQLNISTFSSKIMLEQVTLSFAASIADTEIEYTSKIPPNLPMIEGDEIRLKQVIRNLLRNAYEASLPDKTIVLKASATDTDLIIQIQDTGCGISEADLPHIFEPFVTHKKDGTGLGLAISKQILSAHGGTIEAASKPSLGTSFTVTLPLVHPSFEEQ